MKALLYIAAMVAVILVAISVTNCANSDFEEVKKEKSPAPGWEVVGSYKDGKCQILYRCVEGRDVYWSICKSSYWSSSISTN